MLFGEIGEDQIQQVCVQRLSRSRKGKGKASGHPCCCEGPCLAGSGPQFSHLENGANSAGEMENLWLCEET